MEPTRHDFEQLEKGDKGASARIDQHVLKLRAADPTLSYTEHYKRARIRAFAQKPTSIPTIKAAPVSAAPSKPKPDSTHHIGNVRAVLAEVLAASRATGDRLCAITPEQGSRIREAAAACPDAFAFSGLWQVRALGHPTNCDGQNRMGPHYIARLLAQVDSVIAAHTDSAA